ncbi:MAG: hypothetical protein WAQ28_08900 [Bacteroidia bacterium]
MNTIISANIEFIDNFAFQLLNTMEYIGKRISIKRTEEGLSIVILALADKLKNRLLLAWLVLWTLAGMIVFSQYFTITDPNTKIAVIVWMGFWFYFEFKITNAWLWRRSGKEVLKIRNNKLEYKRDVSGRGKIQSYSADFIKEIRLLEPKESFLESLNNSYWVIAGEKLAFDYYGKEIKLGLQLDDTDAKALLKVIKGGLK